MDVIDQRELVGALLEFTPSISTFLMDNWQTETVSIQ